MTTSSRLAQDVHKRDQANIWVSEPHFDTLHSARMDFEIPATVATLRFADLMEVQRQAGMLQVHRQMGASSDDIFILDRISLRAGPRGVAGREECRCGVIRSYIVESPTRTPKARCIEQRFLIEIEGGIVASGRSFATIVPESLHRRLRAYVQGVTHSPPASWHVGGESLPLDPEDPVLSDHHSDHFTAMQVALGIESLVRKRRPSESISSIRLKFLSYMDLASEPALVLRLSSAGRLRGHVIQSGQLKVEAHGRLGSSQPEQHAR